MFEIHINGTPATTPPQKAPPNFAATSMQIIAVPVAKPLAVYDFIEPERFRASTV